MKKNYLKKRWTSLFIMLFMACSTQAQTFVDVNATGANDGTSWTDAYTDLQIAIDATAAGDSVFVAKGEFTAPALVSFVMKEGVKIYGSFQGTETYLVDRVIGTNLGDTSVLKGNNAKVINNTLLTTASVLDGFKITEGSDAGIYNDDASPTLSNLTITMNSGDGIFNNMSSPIISNVIIHANLMNGIANEDSSPALINLVLTGNQENGILNNESSPTLKNLTIAGNLLAGISNVMNSTSAIHNSIVLGNTTGVVNDGTSTSAIQYSLVQDSSNVMNGNLDATGVLATTIFVDAIAPGNSNAGDYSVKPCAITIDAGSNALATYPTDVLGNVRIFNTTVDMGAYERDVAPDNPVVTTNVTDAICAGGSTGEIELTITGGLAPYTFDWGGGITTQNRTALAAGSYTVTVKDDNGCSTTATASVLDPTPVTGTTTQTNVTGCFGAATGEATVTASGGTSPYTYSWSPGGATTATATNLTGGTYTVTIKDSKLCEGTATVTITEPSEITLLIDTTSCVSVTFNGEEYDVTGTYSQVETAANGCDSTITYNVTITGPTTSTTDHTECVASTYDWNGTTYTDAGTYTFATTNAAGCDSTATLNLIFGTSTTSTFTKAACNSYTWNGTLYTTAGTYTFNTTNAAGCDSTATLILTIGTPFAASVTIVNQNKLQAVAAGSNLTYRWVDCDLNAYIPGETNATLTVTRNGKYAVEVSDGVCKTMSACVNMTQAGVNDNEDLNVGIQVYPNPTDGLVTIAMSGTNQADVRIFDASGKLIKTFLNFHSEDSISIEELTTGVYTLQIQTQNGVKMERLMKN